MRSNRTVFGAKKTLLLAVMVGLAACSSIPQAESVTPAEGTGSDLTFEAKFSDAKGVNNLREVGVNINNARKGGGGCYVIYVVTHDRFVLVNDTGVGSVPLEPGAHKAVENTQCVLSPTGWAVTRNGNEIAIKASVKFKPAFSGKKNVYLYAQNKERGLALRQKGSWVVP